ncbi:MAG: flagellar motor switch protein FliN [Deltaproteobacteria bacterium]|nr:flagellar motor switch protein FliN [Deltaproteobacteria bacterium]
MADDMNFESFDNLEDLDWSELEGDMQKSKEDVAADMDSGAGSGPVGGTASEYSEGSGGEPPIDIDYLVDVNLDISVEVGRRTAYVSEVLSFEKDSIIELNKLVGEPLNLLVNGKRVAKGEVVVVNEKFALKITEILDPKDRLNLI